MPRTSRKAELQDLLLYCGFQSISDPQDALLDEEEILLFQAFLESHRYPVGHPNNGVKVKPLWWQVAMFELNYNEDSFKSHFRMSRPTFWRICDLISGNRVFENSKEPIHLQLGTALYRFGCYGNGSGKLHIATKFGIAEGSALLFTDRVIESLTSMSKQYIKWPDADERKKIGDSMGQNFLPKCIGFVDGSDAILHCSPTDNKETYWSRKKKYCMQFQIVCDPEKRIRDLFVGFPGSVHDSKVYRSSPLGITPDIYFSSGEYIVGDSAYALSDTVVVPFRRSNTGLSSNQKRFNCHISSHRVVVEHTIGILKGRFQSLRGLRIHIANTAGHKKACKWIHACAILHNYLAADDQWAEQLVLQPDTDNDDECIETDSRLGSGLDKRQDLLDNYVNTINE